MFGETGPSLAEIYILPRSMDRFDPFFLAENRDLGIFKIANIDEVDRIYMASPRGLSEGKTEPPDYILMSSSANVPDITYIIKFGDCCPLFLKANILEFHQG